MEIHKKENKYEFNLDDFTVNLEYSQNNKTFLECITNILKDKTQNL